MQMMDTTKFSMTLRPGVRAVAFVALGAMAAACGSGEREAPVPGPAAPQSLASAPLPERVRVVALGDSLTAGYGLESDQAYPALLESRLRDAGLDVDVVNAGVSGDTSAGGLRRLDWSLDGDVRVLIVALGGNDALRGLEVGQLRSNLSAIIERAQQRGIAVILAGMEAPPNMGPAYTSSFRAVYRELATRYEVAYLPFLLEGVAGLAALNQRDGIHPNAAGTERVADNLWPLVEQAVRAAVHP